MTMVLLPRIIFQAQQHTSLLKNTTHGAVKFMSWMKDCKVTYLDYPSGNTTNVHVSILVTHKFHAGSVYMLLNAETGHVSVELTSSICRTDLFNLAGTHADRPP